MQILYRQRRWLIQNSADALLLRSIMVLMAALLFNILCFLIRSEFEIGMDFTLLEKFVTLPSIIHTVKYITLNAYLLYKCI